VTTEDAKETVLRTLRTIAPEIEPEHGDPAADLRDEVDLDSMDFLNLVLGVSREVGVEIPESDYPRLRSLDGWVAYLAERAPGG
jgi:acyl carrier protein